MDLNGDGYIDLLSGSYSRKHKDMAGLFQVLWGTKDGGFKKPSILHGDDGEPLIIYCDKKRVTDQINTRPTAVDLDGDGKLDIVSGNFVGTFAMFKGLGEGRFSAKPNWLTANDKPLKVDGYSDPFFVDWDSDGDLDMLSGSKAGGVFLFTNKGSAQEPRFQTQTTILEPAPKMTPKQMRNRNVQIGDSHITAPRQATRVFVADINADGKLDILIGDNGAVYYPAKDLSVAEARDALVRWEKKEANLMEARAKKDSDVDSKALIKHFKTRNEFESLQLAGFVWVMYGK